MAAISSIIAVNVAPTPAAENHIAGLVTVALGVIWTSNGSAATAPATNRR